MVKGGRGVGEGEVANYGEADALLILSERKGKAIGGALPCWRRLRRRWFGETFLVVMSTKEVLEA